MPKGDDSATDRGHSQAWFARLDWQAKSPAEASKLASKRAFLMIPVRCALGLGRLAAWGSLFFPSALYYSISSIATLISITIYLVEDAETVPVCTDLSILHGCLVICDMI